MARDDDVPDYSRPMVYGGYPGWDPREATRKGEEFQAQMRARHKEKIAERKRLRDEAKRQAKGLLTKPIDYPWLKPDWVEPPVRPFKRP